MRFWLLTLLVLISCAPSKKVKKQQDDPSKEEGHDNAIVLQKTTSPGKVLAKHGFPITAKGKGYIQTGWKEHGSFKMKINAIVDSNRVTLTGKIKKPRLGVMDASYNKGMRTVFNAAWKEMKEIAMETGTIRKYTVR